MKTEMEFFNDNGVEIVIATVFGIIAIRMDVVLMHIEKAMVRIAASYRDPATTPVGSWSRIHPPVRRIRNQAHRIVKDRSIVSNREQFVETMEIAGVIALIVAIMIPVGNFLYSLAGK